MPGMIVDAEGPDDNGIGDADGIDFDAEPDDNGIADEGGLQEQHGGRHDGFDGSGYKIGSDMLVDRVFGGPRVKSYELVGPDGRPYTLVPILPRTVRQ